MLPKLWSVVELAVRWRKTLVIVMSWPSPPSLCMVLNGTSEKGLCSSGLGTKPSSTDASTDVRDWRELPRLALLAERPRAKGGEAGTRFVGDEKRRLLGGARGGVVAAQGLLEKVGCGSRSFTALLRELARANDVFVGVGVGV